MPDPSRVTDIIATYRGRAEGEAALGALIDAGISASCIRLRHNVFRDARQRQGRFVSRVLIVIVVWSIVGGVIGAGLGWLLASTIGPEGGAGLIVQLVSWIIVGHLIAGMLAGYFVLADRTQREMPPDRPMSVLTVRVMTHDDAEKVRHLLRSHDPADLSVKRPQA